MDTISYLCTSEVRRQRETTEAESQCVSQARWPRLPHMAPETIYRTLFERAVNELDWIARS